ncbi:MAG: dihydroorotase [Flavobacteriales bacterium]|nr:dihydroorotase [Flavobacteriales bacterium]|tara:strand:+ start:282427 stop:283758 length:1332 start_codon:yes stop_codon:yes gene_type:complete
MQILIKNACVVNQNKIFSSDVLVQNQKIYKVAKNIDASPDKVIDADGLFLIPGIIDDQVHFREPGLTHKATIATESKAAIAGGITSFMEMPNTKPQALTQKLLEDKFKIASKNSLANFSFFMGASNDNLDEILKTNPKNVGAIKIFMGSSTGNMLVDNKKVLEEIFSKSKMPIAVHCEDENTIKHNLSNAIKKYGKKIPMDEHPKIRSVEACYKSSKLAVELAKKHNTRLHVFHVSTEKEIELFENNSELSSKKITAEVCIHHLYFDEDDYQSKGSLIKWNPAVKKSTDRKALLRALINNKIDVIATDHAPHTIEEKKKNYLDAPSGGPLVQHALNVMLDFYQKGEISLEKIVEKMCHNPAICFNIQKRGFIKEGYYADLVLIDLNKSWKVNKENILYKCKWSPFEDKIFKGKVTHTIVNGNIVYENGIFDENKKGMRLLFDR